MEGAEGPTVVLRYRNGEVLRCELDQEFTPGDPSITVRLADEPAATISLEDLKAVFFLKDPRRRQIELDYGLPPSETPQGAEATVEFFDGEIIRGRIGRYSLRDLGFFLYPTAVETNNERIFVVAGALRSLALEG